MKKGGLVPIFFYLFAYVARAQGKNVCGIIDYVKQNLIDPVITLLLVLASLLFIWGVIEFLAGSANEEARTKGKRHMIWGLVGLLIMISVRMLIIIIQDFFGAGDPICP